MNTLCSPLSRANLGRRVPVPVPVPAATGTAVRPLRRHLHLGSRRISLCVSAGKKPAPPAPAEDIDDIPSYFQDASVVESDSSSVRTAAAGIDGERAGESVGATVGVAPRESVAPPPTSFWSSVPPLVWIGVGVLLGNVVGTALEFVKGGPQKMQEMAMQQMMKQMMKGAGGAGGMGGMGGMGGFPPMPPMPPMGAGMGGFPPAPGAGGASPFSGVSPIETSGGSAAGASSTSSSATVEPAAARETVTPSAVQEGTQTSSTKKKSAFKDVDVDTSSTSSSTSASTSASGSSEGKGFFDANPTSQAAAASESAPPTPPPGVDPASASASASSSASADASSNFSSSMLDMLKDENMQKMLYPYLPEPMRNPQTFEWMLNDPTMRKQLEDMMQGQMAGGAPGAGAPNAVQDLMRDADMTPEKMQEQFNQMGMDPSEMVSKIMADPELAQLMTKPSVLSAIAECSKDPMALAKYTGDKEVMLVFEKMSSMFPGAAGGMGGGGFPGM